MISVAAELAEMHPQTLRMYEARGLIEPQRSPKGTRLYSQDDVDRLRRIQEMTTELGMNLAGVERVFELEAQLERMQRRVRALEEQAEALEAEMATARGGPPLVQRRDRALRGAGDGAGAGRRAPLAPRALVVVAPAVAGVAMAAMVVAGLALAMAAVIVAGLGLATVAAVVHGLVLVVDLDRAVVLGVVASAAPVSVGGGVAPEPCSCGGAVLAPVFPPVLAAVLSPHVRGRGLRGRGRGGLWRWWCRPRSHPRRGRRWRVRRGR